MSHAQPVRNATLVARSRKKINSSISRHFSGWKERQFVLNEEDGTLRVFSRTTVHPVVIQLKDASIKRHHYIRTPNAKGSAPNSELHFVSIVEKYLEIVIEFTAVETGNYWLKQWLGAAKRQNKFTNEESDIIICTLGSYFRDKINLQVRARDTN
jgi:hypothetical protein